MMHRLASGIFLLDCELSIFYRNAPSIMLVEMDGDLPSREDVFSAESVDGWMASIPLDTLELRSSVSSVVEQLLHDTWEESVRTDTPMISVHGLFLVLCGMSCFDEVPIDSINLEFRASSSHLSLSDQSHKHLWQTPTRPCRRKVEEVVGREGGYLKYRRAWRLCQSNSRLRVWVACSCSTAGEAISESSSFRP